MTPTESFQTVEFYFIGIFYPNETINRKRMISKKNELIKKLINLVTYFHLERMIQFFLLMFVYNIVIFPIKSLSYTLGIGW